MLICSPHIAPACLPQRYQEFVGSRCWVTGWGKDNFGTGGRYQNILKVGFDETNFLECTS